MKYRMKHARIFTALLSLLASSAFGMTINPNGTGQVLIFPYYTVNKSQQTLITVSNPTTAAKAVEVLFRESYNGKVVYAIDVFLAPHQTWASGLFALADVNEPSNGVGIPVNLDVCSEPQVYVPLAQMNPGPTYDTFSDAAFTGANVDGGPTDDSREREGFIEVFELAEIHGTTATTVWPNTSTENCVELAPPTIPSDFTAPTGGLLGNVAVIDVAQGTFFAFEPKAIDGFRVQPILPPANETLEMGGDDTSDTVSASIVDHGSIRKLTFDRSFGIDAASALFMTDALYGELDETQAIGANTDWVLTFPTKQYYVDPQLGGAAPPFAFVFGDPTDPGHGSYVQSFYGLYAHDGTSLNSCGFSGCPISPPFIEFQTQVISFAAQQAITSAVLGSAVVTPALAPNGSASATLSFSGELDASNEGDVLHGVPVFGVQAIDYVNSNVSAGVLANYSGTARLRANVTCSNGANACE